MTRPNQGLSLLKTNYWDSDSSSTNWDHVLASISDSEDTESSSDESQISVAWDATGDKDSSKAQLSTLTVKRHLDQ